MPIIPVLKLGLWNAWIFMSVFLLQMLTILFADKHVWERSHIPSEARQNTLEHYASIIGNIIWFIAMVYSVFLPLQLNTIWFYIGIFIFIIGLIIIGIATFNFISTPADQLITKGAYRFSRHPIYLASILICLGTGIASISWLFIFFSVIMGFCFHKEALIEERYCLRKYDTSYQKYMNNVPRWLGIL